MFDLGWPELFIIVVVTLLVVGPKDLPGVLRTVTGTLRKARGMARELQRGIEDIAKETGVHDLKRDLERSTDFTKDLADLNADVEDALGPPKADAGNSIMSPAASKKLAADKARASDKAAAEANGAAAEASGTADKAAEVSAAGETHAAAAKAETAPPKPPATPSTKPSAADSGAAESGGLAATASAAPVKPTT